MEVSHVQTQVRRTAVFFETMSKRRKGFPSETQVKRGVRIVHGDKLLEEKLGRNDLCPCGSLTAPYMHDGSQKTLEEVVEHYNKGGTPNKCLSDKIKKLNLKDQDKKDLIEFMKACTGDFPKVETGRLPK